MKMTPQAWIFAVVFLVVVFIEFLKELSLSDLIPHDARAERVRFWASYTASLALILLAGYVMFLGVNCIADAGWKKTSLLSLAFPFALLCGGYLIHGVDTVLASEAGTGSLRLITNALSKKKCKTTKNASPTPNPVAQKRDASDAGKHADTAKQQRHAFANQD